MNTATARVQSKLGMVILLFIIKYWAKLQKSHMNCTWIPSLIYLCTSFPLGHINAAAINHIGVCFGSQ